MQNNNCKNQNEQTPKATTGTYTYYQIKKAKAVQDKWFDSDEGELVAEAKAHGGGYFTSAKRRTVNSKGIITTRYTFTLPDGTIQRHMEYGDGCHSAVDHDHCGCKKCDALYGPWMGNHVYEFIN